LQVHNSLLQQTLNC